MPPGFHAGGLRYHGMAPLVSHLKELGLIEARALPSDRMLRGGRVLRAERRASCRRPRPITRSRRPSTRPSAARNEGVSRAILFNLCGHGHFDMQAYQDYFAGKLTDQSYDEGELAMALAGLPSVPA